MIKFFVLLSLLFLISACDSHPDKKVLRVGTNIWPGYEALHLAQTEKLFKENIKVTAFDSATTVLNQYRQKQIDVAALTLDEVILLHDQGYTPVIIAVLDISEGADVVIARNDIKSIDELKGKSIGVENTALGSYIFARLLEKAKLDYKDITLVPIAVNRHEDAFKEKVVDAVITFEPVRSELLQTGGLEIFSSKDIPAEIVDVMVIQKDLIDTKFTVDLLQGWSKAVSQINRRDNNAIKLISQRLNQSEQEFIASLEGLHIPSLEESNKLIQEGILESTIIKVSNIMLEKNLIKSDINTKNILR